MKECTKSTATCFVVDAAVALLECSRVDIIRRANVCLYKWIDLGASDVSAAADASTMAARLLPLTVVHMAAFNSRMWIGVHVGHNGHRLLESPGANQVMQCQITQ